MENINGYHDLLVAIVVQAINDYLWINREKKVNPAERMDDEELDSFLHDMFSDESKIQAIKARAKELRDSGVRSI